MKLLNDIKRLLVLIFIMSLMFVILMSWLDYLTGPYITLSLFYLVPIALITWYCGTKYGYVSVVFSACLVLVADLLWKLPAIHSFIPYWNTSIKTVIFVITVIGVTKIKENTLAIRQAMQKESLLARTDPLTGIANSRYFYEILEHEANKARRYKHPITIAYIDLDNFKDANDQYGHLIGDEILKKIAEIIQKNIRNIDMAARLGGDEFTILMPETTMENARSVIKRLLKVITEQAQINNWSITASIGVGSFDKIPDSTDIMISNVDNLMYQAKHKGKNRFEERSFNE